MQHISGYVNKQNCRIWGSENYQIIEERPLHAEKDPVWCALWYEGVIEPYFFEHEDGTTVSERYGHRLILPAIEESYLKNMWFQQKGDTWREYGLIPQDLTT